MNKKYGFTFIELLLVIAIIAILAAILLPALSRAREADGIAPMLITDINNAGASAHSQSTIPIIWDTIGANEFGDSGNAMGVFNHLPGGSNVLFLDGHVSYMSYSASEFPLTNVNRYLKENSHYGLG